jgi:hypothetical protein
MKVSVPIRAILLAAALALLAGCGSGGLSAGTSGATASVKSAPSLSGSAPTTATVGQTYSFAPQVIGGTGTLTFSIQNKPSWATFNASTGTLSGTPQAGNVGTYFNIVISVSDGAGSGSLPSFSITVAQSGSGAGNATVSWTAPTANTDGSALTDLAGYRIYYGTSSNALNNVVPVSIGVTSYVVEGLTSGTWYFAVRAYTTAGTESALSNIASKTIT